MNSFNKTEDAILLTWSVYTASKGSSFSRLFGLDCCCSLTVIELYARGGGGVLDIYVVDFFNTARG